MRRVVVLLAIAVAVPGAAVVAAGCIPDLKSLPESLVLDGGEPDADDGGPVADATTEGPDAAPTNGCPTTGGAMVAVVGTDGKTFCIDATEVTQAAYGQFLKASAGAGFDAGTDARCAWNTSFAPHCGYDPQGLGAYPIACVNWCDAFAYCKWAGKRLCGHVGGGPVGTQAGDDPAVSEWYAVCSRNKTRTWPYGSTADPNACNTQENDAGAAVATGSKTACQGGVDGVFDMSANVSEFEDACSDVDGGDPKGAGCLVRGGSFDSPASRATCTSRASQGRDYYSDTAGVRCCADPR